LTIFFHLSTDRQTDKYAETHKDGQKNNILGRKKTIPDSNLPFSADTVGWATGRASSLLEVWCWFVGDDLTGALHDLTGCHYHFHHP